MVMVGSVNDGVKRGARAKPQAKLERGWHPTRVEGYPSMIYWARITYRFKNILSAV